MQKIKDKNMTLTLNPQTQSQIDALLAFVKALNIPICESSEMCGNTGHSSVCVCSPDEITEEEMEKIVSGAKLKKTKMIKEWL